MAIAFLALVFPLARQLAARRKIGSP
jgi:hypothetical protein